MSDLIDRQAAIDALDEQIEQCNKSLSSFDISLKDEYAVKVERASLVAFREILEYLPPAQLGTNLAEVGTDCISRQQAIDIAKDLTITVEGYEMHNRAVMNYCADIMQLPPIQPEIIRCKDCKHYEHGICKKAGLCINKSPNGFCDWGDRREVTT